MIEKKEYHIEKSFIRSFGDSISIAAEKMKPDIGISRIASTVAGVFKRISTPRAFSLISQAALKKRWRSMTALPPQNRKILAVISIINSTA